MNSLELLTRINTLLGRFAYEVRVSNAIGMFDINTIAEDFLIPILSVVLDCPELKNQNRVKMNFPAVDLGCDKSRTSIQITSNPSSPKICKTLKKFQEHKLHTHFDKLYVYVITERQKTYQSSILDAEIARLSIQFNTEKHILDYKDLAKKIGELSCENQTIIKNHLESAFNKIDQNLQFRNNLTEFISVSQKKIVDEKKSKKYIPSVFVETSEIKDNVRYFVNPLFFYRKIDYDLQNINFEHFNNALAMAKVESLGIDIKDTVCFPVPNSLMELNKRLLKQQEIIEKFLNVLSPFSWRSNKSNKYTPTADLQDYWKVFKLNIESNGNGVCRNLEDVLVKIRIAYAKIFLITGMAGQGKTNFVCDLVENQFRHFEVPTIFIPARLLNHYPGPNRILSYITNNRFCPNLTTTHELFELLNSVSVESGKPFIIALDGINEVSDLQGFVNELKVFLEALCQYDFVKIIITCRNEFFDHKFSGVFDPQFSESLYRVKDLRNEMSDYNKSKLLTEYFEHFNINARLSEGAEEFIKNDLILLRLFCEIYEEQDIGYVSNIYKGELFERYLMMKINEFPHEQRSTAIFALRKICNTMLTNADFSLVSNAAFDAIERQVIEKLVCEDIILRREVPPSGLISLGIENISFTYDEMRDFLLAYFIVVDTEKEGQEFNIFDRMNKWPVYEGLFRYTYILARKYNNRNILSKCESSKDFNYHYINNLSLLSLDLQSIEDVERVKNILESSSSSRKEIQSIAWFLFRKRNVTELLNLGILNEHLSNLNDTESERFLNLMYCDNRGYGHWDWRGKLSEQVGSLKELSHEEKLSLEPLILAFILYLLPYVYWNEKEYTLNFFTTYKEHPHVIAAMDSCREARSERVQSCLSEFVQGVAEL